MTLEEATKKADQVADGLGLPIDENIKNLVIGLWVNDIQTSGSCEGHKNWGEPFPWVDIETEEPEGVDDNKLKQLKWKRANNKQVKKFKKLLKNYQKKTTLKLTFTMWNRGAFGAIRVEFKDESNKPSKKPLAELQKQMNDFALYLIGLRKTH